MAGQLYLGIPREKIPWNPSIDSEKCTGCHECLEICPNSVFQVDDADGKVKVVNPNNCVVLCDKCTRFCDHAAIAFPDKEKTKALVAQLFKTTQEASQ